MIHEFEQFMKQRGAWDLFTRNLKKDINYLNETDPCDYIASAFNWERSPEGRGFWIDIQDEWDVYCRTLNKR